jgi:hypothetical protein
MCRPEKQTEGVSGKGLKRIRQRTSIQTGDLDRSRRGEGSVRTGVESAGPRHARSPCRTSYLSTSYIDMRMHYDSGRETARRLTPSTCLALPRAVRN